MLQESLRMGKGMFNCLPLLRQAGSKARECGRSLETGMDVHLPAVDSVTNGGRQ